MNEDVFVGLDVHRKSIVATVLDKEGRQLDQSKLGAGDDELVEYLRDLPGRKHVALEACSVWEHVYDAAKSTGAVVELAHPKKTRLIAEATLKTDKVDSHALAELIRMNGISQAYAPEKPVRELRQLVRDRRYYKQMETGVKNHIYSFLLRKGTQYDDGVLGLKKKREKLRELKIPEVDRGLDMLKSVGETLKTVDREIRRAFLASKEAQLLASIPGIAEVNAMTLVAEICPIDRFANVEKFCSYAGLVPTTRQSGERVYHGRVNWECNHLVQTVLVEATWSHRMWAKNSDVSKKGRRVARKAGKGKGNIAAAHKLARIVYAILKRGTPYTPERPGHGNLLAES
jgi:transposase